MAGLPRLRRALYSELPGPQQVVTEAGTAKQTPRTHGGLRAILHSYAGTGQRLAPWAPYAKDANEKARGVSKLRFRLKDGSFPSMNQSFETPQPSCLSGDGSNVLAGGQAGLYRQLTAR